MDLIIIMIKLKGLCGVMCVVLSNVFMNTVMENVHA